MELILVRHGESAANAAGRWQGQNDSPLTDRGLEQAARLARRLGGRPFDAVLSSDLQRARQTAEVLGRGVDSSPAFREIDIGAWEGLTRDEFAQRFPDARRALIDGEPIRLGGGETMAEFQDRAWSAIEQVRRDTDSSDRVLLVGHGGFIHAVTMRALGLSGRAPVGFLANTAMTTLRATEDGWRVMRFNDATHLAPLAGWAAERAAEGDTVVTLIRHGQTDANVTGRWQGLGDDPLNEEGLRQSAALAGWYQELDVLYASHLDRARWTAQALGGRALDVAERTDLHEIAMGAWEGRTVEEIQEGWGNLFHRIYEGGEDLPRGETGEAFAEAAARMRAALEELTERHAGARIGVVSHGGAIRAYLGDVLGLGLGIRRRLVVPENTSVTHVVVTEAGPVMADFNLAPHLEAVPVGSG